MSKTIDFGIGTGSYSALRSATRNFNQQRRREIARMPEAADYLPGPRSLRKLKKQITTEPELKFEIESMKSFADPKEHTVLTGDSGLKMTKWEHDYLSQKVEKINQQRQKERERANISPDRGTMHSLKDNDLLPKTFNFQNVPSGKKALQGGKAFELWKKSVENQAREHYYIEKADIYKENYLKTVRANLGKDGKKLYELIKKIPANVLYESYYDDPVLQIGFVSPPLNTKDIAAEAIEHWQDLVEDIIEQEGEESQ